MSGLPVILFSMQKRIFYKRQLIVHKHNTVFFFVNATFLLLNVNFRLTGIPAALWCFLGVGRRELLQFVMQNSSALSWDGDGGHVSLVTCWGNQKTGTQQTSVQSVCPKPLSSIATLILIFILNVILFNQDCDDNYTGLWLWTIWTNFNWKIPVRRQSVTQEGKKLMKELVS